MITEKTEDGGARFSVVNFDEQQRTLWVSAISEDQSKEPVKPIEVLYGTRSEPIDVDYGKYEVF